MKTLQFDLVVASVIEEVLNECSGRRVYILHTKVVWPQRESDSEITKQVYMSLVDAVSAWRK